ncbi:DNA translocase FtsK [Candidatus Thiosymbion oneisti]|uniref:DNA translocase FtsK n=1 Tax=Candidatus Thiosymbion oneisti TaxID=589554 RepID=UPI000AE474FD|nr:DNA translocase FtsK [Candidatus Thiosymbion oneisti]
MAQATRVGTLTFSDYLQRGIREGALWALLCVALYLLLTLVTYSPQDPAWSHIGYGGIVTNAGGRVGAWFSDIAFYLFGILSFSIPVMVAWSGYLIFRKPEPEPEIRLHKLALGWFGFLFALVAGCAFASIYLPALGAELPNGTGGGLGLLLGDSMILAFGPKGTTVFLLGLFLAGFRLLTGISWLAVLDTLGGSVLALMRWVKDGTWFPLWRRRSPADGEERDEPVLPEAPELSESYQPEMPPVAEPGPPPEQSKPERSKPVTAAAPAAAQDGPQLEGSQFLGEGRPPSLELLDPPRKSGKGYTEEMLEDLSRQVEAKLADFGVVAEVVAVHTGPVVALLELQLAPGTKVSKITGLAKDIARALSTVSVRVVEVIPGKSVIGLEIPNEHRETVFLSEVLTSPTYQDAKAPLTLAMGTDIAGQPVCADLARMPHALIAGTTGSGKSVAINVMILSLVYKSTPKDVRLIMVDPKMLELSVYEGIPHLLTPVVTDMKEAASALRWCVAEMERRYRLMAQLGVRNIAGYNRKVADAEAAGEPIPDPLFVTEPGGLGVNETEAVPHLAHLPYIVVIIDELADMMMVVGKKVEELIARLAQKARASGIHLLLATQRPSVDVLTGLIKANIPTRMAFQVSSRIDSRTVLDQMGAEHLLGWGDMLYLPPGTSIPQRVHGAFVDDQEVHRVAEHLKRTGAPDYINTVLQDTGEAIPGIDPDSSGGDTEDQDPLFDEAVQFVTETRRASISGVQRRLKIGYNRAARMVEEMERIGLVGPAETNGNREVLVPPPPEA